MEKKLEDEWTNWKPRCGLSVCNEIPCYLDAIKSFIRKVEEEAYERGYKDGKADSLDQRG